MHSRLARLASLIALGAVGGCDSGVTPPATVPVSGQVLLKGKPAAGVRVTLHPRFDIGKRDFKPSGETDRQGKFTLSTGAPGNGAPSGEYAVTFEKPRTESDRRNSGIEVEVDDFKGKYSDPATSGNVVTVGRESTVLGPFKLD